MKQKFSIMLSIVLCLSLFLTACSGSKKPADGNNNASKESSSEEGGTLIFGRGADAVALDPINVTDGESIRATNNIFETLFQYDEQLKLQPKLAKAYEASEDGLTWTLTLRDGVKFHDGTDFNADAVVFNFERWMDKDNPYHDGDFTYYSFLYGGFKGEPGHIVEYVKAVDPLTVEIKLTQKTAPFISYLAIPMFGIASPEAVKKYDDKFYENPVGTGPFQFVSWSRNDKIVLEKNENYYVEGKPVLDQLIFRVIPENSARLNALQTGEIDMLDGMNPDDKSLLEGDSALTYIERPSFNIGFMAFNMEKEPLNDVKVRKAIDLAINKQAIVDAFYNGTADVAKNPIPPSLWGYNEDVQAAEYNVEEAKKLLKEAGLENGFDTEIWTMDNPRPYMSQPMKIAEAIQADLKKIGINAKIVTYEWTTYLEKTGQGEHDMALFGWTGVMADPDNFLFPNLSATNAVVPAQNRAFYKNAEFTDLLQTARTTLEQEKRIELYQQAQAIFHEDTPWALLFHTTPPMAAGSYVKGFTPHPMNDDSFAGVSLEK
jgi:peptide/nickel transport system substrate-binding protein